MKKRKFKIYLTPAENSIVIQSLNHLRNTMLRENRDTGCLDELLLKAIRAQELTDEACLLSRHRIDTLEQLNAYRSDVKSQFAGLTEQRKSLYRKLRTKAVLADPARQEYIRAEISKLSAQIKELRREVKLCGDIALRSTSIKDKIQAAREEVSGRDEKARQEPEQGRAAPPGRR